MLGNRLFQTTSVCRGSDLKKRGDLTPDPSPTLRLRSGQAGEGRAEGGRGKQANRARRGRSVEKDDYSVVKVRELNSCSSQASGLPEPKGGLCTRAAVEGEIGQEVGEFNGAHIR